MNQTRFKNLVILTGAGISAESGVRTFRDAHGLWENHRIEDVASPEGFFRNPQLVHQFYNDRRRQLLEVTPNAAHFSLVELEENWEGNFLLVTQNVDDLHERAGSKSLVHMHGELLKIFCQNCHSKFEWHDDLTVEIQCMSCGKQKTLRPDIVWFGEIPYQMDFITSHLEAANIFVSIGTSGRVYPAAGFAQYAWKAKRIEVNLEKSDIANDFNEHLTGPASVEVPKLVRRLLTE